MIIIWNETLTFRNSPRTVFSEGRRDREIDMTPISRAKVTVKLTRAQLFFEVKSEEKCIPCYDKMRYSLCCSWSVQFCSPSNSQPSRKVSTVATWLRSDLFRNCPHLDPLHKIKITKPTTQVYVVLWKFFITVFKMKNNGYGTTNFQIKKVLKKFRTIFLEFNLRIDQ